jgi:hypothetical protein
LLYPLLESSSFDPLESPLLDPLLESSSLDPLKSSLLDPLLESSLLDPILESSFVPLWSLLYSTLWSLLCSTPYWSLPESVSQSVRLVSVSRLCLVCLRTQKEQRTYP